MENPTNGSNYLQTSKITNFSIATVILFISTVVTLLVQVSAIIFLGNTIFATVVNHIPSDMLAIASLVLWVISLILTLRFHPSTETEEEIKHKAMKRIKIVGWSGLAATIVASATFIFFLATLEITF